MLKVNLLAYKEEEIYPIILNRDFFPYNENIKYLTNEAEEEFPHHPAVQQLIELAKLLEQAEKDLYRLNKVVDIVEKRQNGDHSRDSALAALDAFVEKSR